MRFHVISAFLSTLTVVALALTLPSSLLSNNVVHEKRDTVIQRKWIPSALDPKYIVPARIGLKYSNLDLGVEHLDEM